jgi:transcription elongation regulator 1
MPVAANFEGHLLMDAPFAALPPPPLPPGWTEHTGILYPLYREFQLRNYIGPNGQPYYFNAVTQESTYIRPVPAFPLYPNGQPILQTATAPPQKKKEKPMVKTPIPGTEWLRVKTTEGNTFYTHKGRKESVWTVPEEIKDAVSALDEEERNAAAQAEEAAILAQQEVERVKAAAKESIGKRKAEAIPVEEVIISKKAKVEDEEDEEDEDEEDEEDESEEEDWQREAAAQLAAEAEEEKKRQEEEQIRAEEAKAREAAEAEVQKTKPLNMPDRVDLSIDEAKALFKVHSFAYHLPICSLFIHGILDIITRKRYQPTASMGYFATSLHF